MVQLQDQASYSTQDSMVDEPNGATFSQILLLGDPGVGKSSLICSLTDEDFAGEEVPPKLEDVTIPGKFAKENVGIRITDYSRRDPSQEDLGDAIQKAAVICIVYIAGSHDSLDRVAKFWLPTIRRAQTNNGMQKPVILAANKIDSNENTHLVPKLDHIRQKFLEVENFVEVSAIEHINIVELISSAQKAITYPMAPLFDPKTRNLTTKCRIALSDIFKLCDHDGDELMNDNEVNKFQESCFGTPLKEDALEDLKNVIRQSTIDGIANNCITLDGFLFIHELSIDKGRQDFTWQVLRNYNYDNQLNLRSTDPATIGESSFGTTAAPTTTTASVSNNTDCSSISSLVEDTKNYLNIDPRSVIRGRELISQLDIAPWLRDNPRMVKTGLGLTVTTFISFMALKFLIQGISKG